MDKSNVIASILFGLGVIEIIAGVILGIGFGSVEVSGLYSRYNEFSWSIFLLWSVGGFVSGMLFIGFSEVIKILDKIQSQLSEASVDKSE